MSVTTPKNTPEGEALRARVLASIQDILTPAEPAQAQKSDPYFDALRNFRKLTGSKFADSLQTLTGAPSATVLAKMGRGTMGQYSKPAKYGDPVQKDTVYLSVELLGRPVGRDPDADPEKYRRQPEYALAHELGHRLEATELASGDSTLSTKYRAMEDSTVDEAIKTGSTLSDDYWLQSPHEHYAEAFAQAVTVLRLTASQPADAARVIAQADSAVPGTSLMLQKLLDHPMYAEHPLKKGGK